MKNPLALYALLLVGIAVAQAAEKGNSDYQDGILISFRTESTGTSCTSSGTVNGSVDDNGTIQGRSDSSSHCNDTVTHLYTVKVGAETLVLRRTLTGGQKTMTMATMGWGALFMKQSVLADQPPGTQFKIRLVGSEAHVKLGKRESVYKLVAESSAQSTSATNPGSSPPATISSSSSVAVLDITSTPAGAEIEIDGAFVGNTPASVEVTPGEHSLTISKKGFVSWDKRLRAMAGHTSISPELEAVANP